MLYCAIGVPTGSVVPTPAGWTLIQRVTGVDNDLLIYVVYDNTSISQFSSAASPPYGNFAAVIAEVQGPAGSPLDINYPFAGLAPVGFTDVRPPTAATNPEIVLLAAETGAEGVSRVSNYSPIAFGFQPGVYVSLYARFLATPIAPNGVLVFDTATVFEYSVTSYHQ